VVGEPHSDLIRELKHRRQVKGSKANRLADWERLLGIKVEPVLFKQARLAGFVTPLSKAQRFLGSLALIQIGAD
jgi:hypothetical protein